MDTRVLGTLLAIMVLSSPVAGGEVVKIGVLRQSSNDKCVTGQVTVAGKIVGYTLERPYEGNLPLISGIKPGTYGGFIRKGDGRWRVQLEGTEPRTVIQFHPGNKPADTKGCVLVGDAVDPDTCTVTDSVKGHARFGLAITAAAKGAPDEDIRTEVTISDK